LEIRFRKRQVSFLVVKTVKCKRGINYFDAIESYTMGRITKANLSWRRTRAKFCQLFTSLPVFMSFFVAMKVRLRDLKFEFCQFKL